MSAFNWFYSKVSPKWEWYVRQFDSYSHAKVLISDERFFVLDMELTGLDAYNDRILSVCCVPVSGNVVQIAEAFACRIEQQYFNEASLSIHELMPGKSKFSLDETEAMLKLFEFIGTGTVVAHFSDVEKHFLDATLKRLANTHFRNPIVDTAKLIGRVSEKYRAAHHVRSDDWQLETVCEHFNIRLEDAHTACGDAFATAILFVKLVHLLDKRGVKKLKEVL